jgi:hypothetical protein
MDRIGRPDKSHFVFSANLLGWRRSRSRDRHGDKPCATPRANASVLRQEVRALLAARDINVWPYEIQ